MQVVENQPPKLADIKRQLQNVQHELEELIETIGVNDQKKAAEVTQTLYRVREAITHAESAERSQR